MPRQHRSSRWARGGDGTLRHLPGAGAWLGPVADSGACFTVHRCRAASARARVNGSAGEVWRDRAGAAAGRARRGLNRRAGVAKVGVARVTSRAERRAAAPVEAAAEAAAEGEPRGEPDAAGDAAEEGRRSRWEAVQGSRPSVFCADLVPPPRACRRARRRVRAGSRPFAVHPPCTRAHRGLPICWRPTACRNTAWLHGVFVSRGLPPAGRSGLMACVRMIPPAERRKVRSSSKPWEDATSDGGRGRSADDPRGESAAGRGGAGAPRGAAGDVAAATRVRPAREGPAYRGNAADVRKGAGAVPRGRAPTERRARGRRRSQGRVRQNCAGGSGSGPATSARAAPGTSIDRNGAGGDRRGGELRAPRWEAVAGIIRISSSACRAPRRARR